MDALFAQTVLLWGGLLLLTQLFLPYVARPPVRVVIAAAYIDTTRSGEPDEAILLWNIGVDDQPLAGWKLSAGIQSVTIPNSSTLHLAPGQRLWCAAEAAAFAQTFGELPACEWAANTRPDVLDLTGKLRLPNDGGALRLIDAAGGAVDVLLYGDEEQPTDGWIGAPAQLYTGDIVSKQGLIWQRKRDPVAELPLDSDRATDWAGDVADVKWGRQVRLPGWQGWDAAGFARATSSRAVATVTAATGPEGLYAPIAGALQGASSAIDLSIYTLEHPDLALLLADAARRGVRIRILLDGAPAGGITELQKWCVGKIAAAGADVRYLAVRSDAPAGYKRRYRYTHAKYGIIDDRLAMVGTENFSLDSMPVPAGGPVGGRRGFYLLTDAAPSVKELQRIFDTDWAPDRFLDLSPFEPSAAMDDSLFAAPPPSERLLNPVKIAPFGQPVNATGPGRLIVATAPENAWRADDGLHALIARAGAGDEIVSMQLYENRNWGDATSNPIADPNPRLQLLIEAARRGARVLLLLDSFFDTPEELRSNRSTVEYVRAVAAHEGLQLEARLGNPTLGGIHAKLMLFRIGAETWSAVGSLNGGEVSYKLNREVTLIVDHAPIYTDLRGVFEHDWALAE